MIFFPLLPASPLSCCTEARGALPLWQTPWHGGHGGTPLAARLRCSGLPEDEAVTAKTTGGNTAQTLTDRMTSNSKHLTGPFKHKKNIFTLNYGGRFWGFVLLLFNATVNSSIPCWLMLFILPSVLQRKKFGNKLSFGRRLLVFFHL